MNAEYIATTASGLAWTITYLALVYRGFKDKSYGMPLVPLALNFAWEVVFSMVYPPQSIGTAGVVVNAIWMLCDIGILVTYFLYSYNHFKQRYGLSKPAWLALSMFAFMVAFGIMLAGAPFFAQFKPYFSGNIFQGAIFIAYFQNLVMSVCFLLMLLERRSMAGQSLLIAVTKLIGTGLTVGIYYLFILHKGQATLMNIVISATFLLDIIYIILIYKQIKREGKNPFTRF